MMDRKTALTYSTFASVMAAEGLYGLGEKTLTLTKEDLAAQKELEEKRREERVKEAQRRAALEAPIIAAAKARRERRNAKRAEIAARQQKG